ncbi:MAG: amino acid ABC transporter substrate-binding protein [Desulfobacterales bacterium]|nr:amino acid ABC transporter substrate-binding protein [Desulfobacterales bacterium]
MKKNFPKTLKTLLFILCVCMCGVIANANTLKIGYEDWEPYQFEDANGKLTGVDIDLVSAILDTAGLQYEFKKMPWKRLINDVENGNVDIGMGASITPDREKFALFTEWYRTEGWSLFMRAEDISKYDFKSLEDIEKTGIKLGIVRGYFYGDNIMKLIESLKAKDKIEEVAVTDLNYKKMIKNRIDAFFEDSFVGPLTIRKNNFTGQIKVHPIDLGKDNVYIMLSKKTINDELYQKINEALKKIKESGKHAEILNNYLK